MLKDNLKCFYLKTDIYLFLNFDTIHIKLSY